MKMHYSRIAEPMHTTVDHQLRNLDSHLTQERYAELTAVSSDVKLRSHCNACHKGKVLEGCPACQRLSAEAK